jgi:hypothetical protein
MAKCKVLSKPDYELTLSSDEREALLKLLCGVSAEEYKEIGCNQGEIDLNNNIHAILVRA